MGIRDEDYADALIYEKQKQALSSITVPNGGNMTGTINAGGFTLGSVQQPYGTFKVLTEEDLQHEAMKAPLSALVDMWVVRWSSKWVGESEFKEDTFWRIALIRLTGANRLEKHNLANQFESVYRVIE